MIFCKFRTKSHLFGDVTNRTKYSVLNQIEQIVSVRKNGSAKSIGSNADWTAALRMKSKFKLR